MAKTIRNEELYEAIDAAETASDISEGLAAALTAIVDVIDAKPNGGEHDYELYKIQGILYDTLV